MKPIVVAKAYASGKIELTEEQLKELVDEVYEGGYQDGKNSVAPITPSYIPNQVYPREWVSPTVIT